MVESVNFDLRDVGPLTLAYMGDAYIELLARESLIKSGKKSISALNNAAMQFVTAKKQSEAAVRLEIHLTEEEHKVFRQGLNSKPRSMPRSATPIEYMRATALECLFGYLYLSGNTARAAELFDICYFSKEADDDRA